MYSAVDSEGIRGGPMGVGLTLVRPGGNAVGGRMGRPVWVIGAPVGLYRRAAACRGGPGGDRPALSGGRCRRGAAAPGRECGDCLFL